MKISFLGFAACLLFTTLISHHVLPTIDLFDHNISITFSENDSEMMIKAKFPSSKSTEVNALLIHYFKLNETMNLDSANVSADGIDGQTMYLSIQSKPGSLKIVLLKSKNASTSVSHLKELGEKLKVILVK